MAVYPDSIKNWSLVERRPNESALKKVLDLFEFLDGIPINEKSPLSIIFSASAQEIANEWRSILEKRLLDPDLSSLKKSYLSKYRSLLPSLALIFEVTRQKGIPHEVSEKSTLLATKWTEILESHMNKILSMGSNSESSAKIILEKIKSGEIYNGQKVREIYRRNWRGLDSPDKVRKALQILINHGYLRKHKEGVGGNSTEVIFINPNFRGAL